MNTIFGMTDTICIFSLHKSYHKVFFSEHQWADLNLRFILYLDKYETYPQNVDSSTMSPVNHLPVNSGRYESRVIFTEGISTYKPAMLLVPHL